MIYFVIFLCVFNVVLWIMFLKNFKKLFTTDDVIEKTRNEYNLLLKDLNRNADRNLTLIDDRITKLNALNEEADKRIKMLLEMKNSEIALSQLNTQVQKASGKKNGTLKKALDAYSRNSSSGFGYDSMSSGSKTSPDKKRVPEDSAVEITEGGKAEAGITGQKSLFDFEVIPDVKKAEVHVADDIPPFYSIPVVTAKTVEPQPEIPVRSKEDLKERIVTLFDSGLSVVQISEELRCSTTEVQFALTLENRL